MPERHSPSFERCASKRLRPQPILSQCQNGILPRSNKTRRRLPCSPHLTTMTTAPSAGLNARTAFSLVRTEYATRQAQAGKSLCLNARTAFSLVRTRPWLRPDGRYRHARLNARTAFSLVRTRDRRRIAGLRRWESQCQNGILPRSNISNAVVSWITQGMSQCQNGILPRSNGRNFLPKGSARRVSMPERHSPSFELAGSWIATTSVFIVSRLNARTAFSLVRTPQLEPRFPAVVLPSQCQNGILPRSNFQFQAVTTPH